MSTEIIMPKAGMDMEEGTVIKWLKQEGDIVQIGEPLLEILTDKVNMEVEAEVSGSILKITAEEGEVLPVFTVIGYIGQEDEKIDMSNSSTTIVSDEEISKSKEIVEKNDIAHNEVSNQNGRVRATPAARKVARDREVDIAIVPGSGPKGRVQLTDVEKFNTVKATPLAEKIAKAGNIDLASIKGTGVGGKITKSDLIIPEQKNQVLIEEKPKISKETKKSKIIPMTGLRKIIADRMTESLRKTAPVTLNIEVDMTNALELRQRLKDIILKETEKKITLTDIIIMACTKALMKYPIVNSTLTDEGIRINDYVNMGIAVGLENGLLVPVIKNTHNMTLKEIVAGRTDIVKKTLSNKVIPDELQGSTFTISNLGMFDTISFNSIINQPNSAILSVGTTVKRMRIINDEPMVRSVMNMSVTIDHRIMDGLNGAQFLQYFKDLLEEPSLLLL
ncbi:MAG: 2-oxo acid dehydrogenase subunit E2 [Eubacteriaceae bacterium]